MEYDPRDAAGVSGRVVLTLPGREDMAVLAVRMD